MSLIDSALGRFVPRVRVGTQYLKEQLSTLGVTVRVSDGCLEELVRDAIAAVAKAGKTEEPYLTCLRRELDSRAQFIFSWTGSDGAFEAEQYRDLVAIARRYALPRPWKGTGPASPSQLQKPRRDKIPAHLVRKSAG